ncbi:hypothetical protein EVAR_17367_1 [Eumeta japonica]|uniref:Uncharacterized protein n=1 Tax=Eumeta variegata TaxID=151549 RepID=A0A4C1WF99_EUMVA|nr:hypothetical protein EVAR_17367_1 [Eumeta japonica]
MEVLDLRPVRLQHGNVLPRPVRCDTLTEHRRNSFRCWVSSVPTPLRLLVFMAAMSSLVVRKLVLPQN